MKLQKHKTWAIYISLVILTVAFALYEYQKSQKVEQIKIKQSRLFPDLELSKVNSFFIYDEKTKQKIVLSQKEGEWKLEQPVTDTANKNIVQGWLKSLIEEKVQLIKKEELDWAEYGLDTNTKKVEISTWDGKKWFFRISHYSAFDGSFYIKRGDTLLLGGTTWASLSNKTGDDFRSYNMVNKTSHPSFIKYKSKAFSAHFKWVDYHWQWAKTKAKESSGHSKASYPISSSELESYWSAFKNLQLEKDTYPNTKERIQQFKLDRPELEFHIGFPKKSLSSYEDFEKSVKNKQQEETQNIPNQVSEKDKKNTQHTEDDHLDRANKFVLQIRISPEINDRFYVHLSNRDYIFSLSKTNREKTLLTEQKIRNHHYPFQFAKDKVAFMDIKGYGLNVSLQKKQGQWNQVVKNIPKGSASNDFADEEKPNKQLNQESKEQESEQDVLNQISQLLAEKYLKKTQVFETHAYIALKDKEKKELLHLQFSLPFAETQKKGQSKNTNFSDKKQKTKFKDKVLVKSNKGQDIMLLPAKSVQALFPASLKKAME